MDGSTQNLQFVINVGIGIALFFGGWILKIIFGLMSKMQEDHKELNRRIQDDYHRLSQEFTSLALHMPEKYVSKDDFNQLEKVVHHRFDRLEEKIDSLKK